MPSDAGPAARGLIRSRPDEAFELLVGRAEVSGRLTAAQGAAEAAGQPLATGFAPAPGSLADPAVAPGIQTSHDFIEANYAFKLTPGVTITPDMHLCRPAATRAVPDALVLAARVEVSF